MPGACFGRASGAAESSENKITFGWKDVPGRGFARPKLELVSLNHGGGHGRQGIGEFAMLKRHWWLLATTAIFAAGTAKAQSPAPDLAPDGAAAGADETSQERVHRGEEEGG